MGRAADAASVLIDMHGMRSTVLASAALVILMAAALPACSSTRLHVAAPVTITVPPAKGSGPMTLHIDDLRMPEGKGAILRVYVNGDFLDELVLVPSRSQASSARPREGQNFIFPVPASVRSGSSMRVKLVPVRGTDVTLKRPYVTIGR